eukprot:8313344-Heterocapsa_arctica.AAC.1
MEDWSLQAAIILEGPRKEKCAPTEVTEPEQNVEDMAVVVMQKDVPEQKTCMIPKKDRQLIKGDIPGDCGNKDCITCNATNPEKQLIDPDFDIQASTLLEHFIDLKMDAQFKQKSSQVGCHR